MTRTKLNQALGGGNTNRLGEPLRSCSYREDGKPCGDTTSHTYTHTHTHSRKHQTPQTNEKSLQEENVKYFTVPMDLYINSLPKIS